MQPKPSFSCLPTFPQFEHDVLLSFGNDEACKAFTERLHKALVERGINTSLGRESRLKADEIDNLTLENIQRSEVFLPVFSQNFAESQWRLKEMAKIVESIRLILPIFYQVDPQDVRNQTGSFFKSFRRYEEDIIDNTEGSNILNCIEILTFCAAKGKAFLDEETIKVWRRALRKAGSMPGFSIEDSCDGKETQMIQKIVQRVLTELRNYPSDVAKHPTGIGSRVKEILKLLDVGKGHVRMIGITGMAGIGKTTLAKAVYNEVYHHFEGSSFISNIRETVEKLGIEALQNQMISDVLKIDSRDVSRRKRGEAHQIREKIGNKLVLIILDDVNDTEQINSLAKDRSWFQSGSRIIITTREKHLLGGLMEEKEIYVSKELTPQQSLELLSWHAFRKETPEDEYVELSKEIVSATKGLPLAIEVIGSYLFDRRSVKLWHEAVEKLACAFSIDVFQKLKISYDSLNDDEKSIFLDIACILNKFNQMDAIHIWNACGFASEDSITTLVQKSLIRIEDNSFLKMHDLLQEMGKLIVAEEASKLETNMQSRIWTREKIIDALKQPTAPNKIEGIRFAGKESDDEPIHIEGFEFMPNLRLLAIGYNAMSVQFKQLPKNVKFLQWHGCPLQSLPDDLEVKEVAVLDVSHSQVVHLGTGTSLNKKIYEKLKVINLTACSLLTAIDFSPFPNLEKLILDGCEKLTEVPVSISQIKRLVLLSMRGCIKLKELPDCISQLASLKTLQLMECFDLQKLPNCFHQLSSLETLLLKYCFSLKEIPNSIFGSTSLKILDLSGCVNLEGLPKSASYSISKTTLQTRHPVEMKDESKHESSSSYSSELQDSMEPLGNLRFLSLQHCNSVEELPSWIGRLNLLESLFLSFSSIKELPESIGSLKELRVLDAAHCRKLTELPNSIGDLESLHELYLAATPLRQLPDSVSCLTKLETLDLSACPLLETLPEAIEQMGSLTKLILDVRH